MSVRAFSSPRVLPKPQVEPNLFGFFVNRSKTSWKLLFEPFEVHTTVKVFTIDGPGIKSIESNCMPYSSLSHLKNSKFIKVCASMLPSLVWLIQEKYRAFEGVFYGVLLLYWRKVFVQIPCNQNRMTQLAIRNDDHTLINIFFL